MLQYMKHEDHGIRICYTVKEVKWDEENGWKKCKAPEGKKNAVEKEEATPEVPKGTKKTGKKDK